ncbi:MAG: ABC transporter permease [Muribaculaceae bacterium]|nr:ABC transporter permease [Muribaculaceae bacterium]
MKISFFDIDNWSEIGATLARNKTRTFLTAFGIFWGTAMLAMLWGGAAGLKGMLLRNFEGQATNQAVVQPARTSMPYKGFNKGMKVRLTQTDLDAIKSRVDNIEASSGVVFNTVNVAYNSKSKSQVFCKGIEPDYFKIEYPVVYAGRIINEADIRQRKKVVNIGRNIAAELFGNEDPVGKFININGVYFQVAGVLGQIGEFHIGDKADDSIILPENVMRSAFAMGNDIDFVMFTAVPGVDPDEIKPALMRVLKSNHPIHPDDDQAIWMMNIAEQFRMVDNVFFGVSLLALFVGAGTLIAGIIGVGNIMWIIVKERTQEIGIRRAIGAKPKDIIMQVLSEGIVLTAVAGLAGIVFATGVLFIVEKLTFDPVTGSAHFMLRFQHAVAIMFIFLLLGIAAGLVPAFKAMKIKPIEAIRDK